MMVIYVILVIFLSLLALSIYENTHYRYILDELNLQQQRQQQQQQGSPLVDGYTNIHPKCVWESGKIRILTHHRSS